MTAMSVFFYLLLIALIAQSCAEENDHPYLPRSREYVPINEELNSEFWFNKAQDILSEKLEQVAKPNTKRAKNIILFLGDGMSVHTIAAARAAMGDSSKKVSFEKFPTSGLSKTYAIDQRVADSASTATAYLSGVKGNYGTIGVNAQVNRFDCNKAAEPSAHTESIAKWAQDAGKWAGLVTTTRVTHASPAGVYAHTANRDWEYDAAIEKDGCSSEVNVDIARQLVEWPVGRALRVIMGGGRRNFRDTDVLDEEDEPGMRTDNRDLIEEWLHDKLQEGATPSYVYSKKGLQTVNLDKTDYLMGLFCSSHCPYHGDLERDNVEDIYPSLTEMTEAAIQLLSKNENGYFLFVEGARIDMAHHSNKAHKAIEDTIEFSRAIELARNITSEEDTLIVVTSDHSHTMTIAGYPYRRQDIFSLAPTLADDGLPYTILSYANGPGYSKTYSSKTGRIDLTNADLSSPTYRYMATVPLDSETHGGEDVGVFASGPYEHYFTGNYEQTVIPALMAHAANIGPFKENRHAKDFL